MTTLVQYGKRHLQSDCVQSGLFESSSASSRLKELVAVQNKIVAAELIGPQARPDPLADPMTIPMSPSLAFARLAHLWQHVQAACPHPTKSVKLLIQGLMVANESTRLSFRAAYKR